MASGIAYAAAARQYFSRTALDLCTTAMIWLIACRALAASGGSRPMIGGIAYTRGAVIYLTRVVALSHSLRRYAAVAIRDIFVFTSTASGGSHPMIRSIAYAPRAVINLTQVGALSLILRRDAVIAAL